ncbi:MAG: hypothetical protein K0R52_84 [Alphaproteobacteria bacterium]|jgi:hypothetical protein|nr:hypothetical protein [Alphaproteobacteria bacterium]
MLSSIKEAILKHLQIIYRYALVAHNRWPLALLEGECQGKHRRTVVNKSDPCHSPLMVSSLKDRTGEKPKNFMAAWEKLYPDREHPPLWPTHNALESPIT